VDAGVSGFDSQWLPQRPPRQTVGLSATKSRGDWSVSVALKLGAGFVLAAAVFVFVEVVLAVFPDPLLTAVVLGPPALGAVVALDTARRRRASARRRGRRR
jgi:hypothetical protein